MELVYEPGEVRDRLVAVYGEEEAVRLFGVWAQMTRFPEELVCNCHGPSRYAVYAQQLRAASCVCHIDDEDSSGLRVIARRVHRLLVDRYGQRSSAVAYGAWMQMRTQGHNPLKGAVSQATYYRIMKMLREIGAVQKTPAGDWSACAPIVVEG
jgi:hypothetical protein